MLGLRQTWTAQTQTTRSIQRVKSWEGELTMACMFNRNLFICLNRRQKNERGKKKKHNIKMDELLVMQMKVIQSRKKKTNTSSSIWINSYKHGGQSKISPTTPHIQICENVWNTSMKRAHNLDWLYHFGWVCPKWNDVIPLILHMWMLIFINTLMSSGNKVTCRFTSDTFPGCWGHVSLTTVWVSCGLSSQLLRYIAYVRTCIYL